MKKMLLPLLLLGVTLGFAFRPAAIDPLPIGAAMPKADVKLTAIYGSDGTLADVRKENGLLVIFSCNTCPYVIKNQSRNNEAAAFAESKGIGVIILNSNEAQREGADSPKEMKKYAAAQQYKWTYAIDKNSEIADAFGATRTPEVYLFDKNNKLVYHGAIDDNPADAAAVTRNHLKAAITDLTSGREISVKTSKSVGCAIKRAK